MPSMAAASLRYHCVSSFTRPTSRACGVHVSRRPRELGAVGAITGVRGRVRVSVRTDDNFHTFALRSGRGFGPLVKAERPRRRRKEWVGLLKHLEPTYLHCVVPYFESRH